MARLRSVASTLADAELVRAQRIQDKVAGWVREERWGALAAEKREVLASMQEVLRSCHTLLNTTQIPMNGVVNLLQHILRCVRSAAAEPPLPVAAACNAASLQRFGRLIAVWMAGLLKPVRRLSDMLLHSSSRAFAACLHGLGLGYMTCLKSRNAAHAQAAP